MFNITIWWTNGQPPAHFFNVRRSGSSGAYAVMLGTETWVYPWHRISRIREQPVPTPEPSDG